MAEAQKDWALDEDVSGEETAAEDSKAPESGVIADPTIPTLVLPKPEVKAFDPLPAKPGIPEPEALMEADNFPTNLKEAFSLLAKFQGADRLGDRPTKDQVTRFHKFVRLRAHVSKLQQGLPAVHTTAHTPGAFVGIQTADSARLNLLVRTNPLVKKVVKERDGLRLEAEDLRKALNSTLSDIQAIAGAVSSATDLVALKKQVSEYLNHAK